MFGWQFEGERRGRDQGAAPAYMLAPWLLDFWRPREHCLEAQIYYQKYVEKIQIPLELILYGLKWREVCFLTNYKDLM